MALRADDVDLGRDRDLVARFQNGDRDAFDDLYRRYSGRLNRFCLRLTGDAHEAEEVAQEAFVKALRNMHTLDGERRFYPWMTVIARRITIDRHRRLSRIELTASPDLGTVEADVDHLFAAVDAGHVRAAMGNLGPRHRQVLELREADGLSYADIAHRLDVPLTTVEALIHRARKALRREFVAAGGERRGLFGVPVLAFVSTRLAGIRARVGDRWGEVVAVAAPIVVGAATAAVVLVPSGDPAPTRLETARSTGSIVETAETVETVATPTDPVVATTAAEPPSPPTTPPTATTTAPTPDVEVGSVDVFVGPDGTDRARAEAEDMPVSGAVGPVTGGAAPDVAGGHTETFMTDVVRIAGAIGDQLLGGNP